MSFIGKVAADHLSQIDGGGFEVDGILGEVHGECRRRVEKWGVQNHPDVIVSDARHIWAEMADQAKETNDARVVDDCICWDYILLEEVYEALAESDPAKLREELVQVAAVAASWIADIDRRGGDSG